MSAVIGANGVRYARDLDIIPVTELGLSTRALRAVQLAKAETVAELSRLSRADFVLQPNCGKKSVQELVDALHRYGVGLCA